MAIKQALISGGILGATIAFAVGMFQNFTFADIIFRMFILGLAGAWIGWMLAWLNVMLPTSKDRKEHHS